MPGLATVTYVERLGTGAELAASRPDTTLPHVGASSAGPPSLATELVTELFGLVASQLFVFAPT